MASACSGWRLRPRTLRPHLRGRGRRAMMTNELTTKQAYINQRLTDELVIWLSTVRPDGRPHLVPMEFYWTGERMVLSTDKRSQKAANLRHNPYVTLALPDGADVVIVEGTA